MLRGISVRTKNAFFHPEISEIAHTSFACHFRASGHIHLIIMIRANLIGSTIRSEGNEDPSVEGEELDEAYSLARWYSDRSAGNGIHVSAYNGNHLAEAYLSILLFHGCANFEKDRVEAERLARSAWPWLQSEVQKRNPLAVFNVVCCFLDGRGTAQNVLEAEMIARRYLRLRHDETLLMYAKIQMQRGFLKYSTAKAIFEQIWEKSDHPEAQYQLGMLEMYKGPVLRDEEVALKWFRAAAKQGHREAIYQTGMCYLEGQGTFRNLSKAVDRFYRAAQFYLDEAQLAYAKCCKEGYGVPQNYPLSAEYYSRAAAKGHFLAQHNLGIMYELGRGVPQNLQQAAVYYKQAAEQDHYPALLSLNRVVAELKS